MPHTNDTLLGLSILVLFSMVADQVGIGGGKKVPSFFLVLLGMIGKGVLL